jgi:hypothetical protein
MKRNCIILIFLFVIVLPCFLYAQTCFAGAGQTVAFTLKAGAKAGWNSSAPIIVKPHDFSNSSISLVVYKPSTGGIAFKATGLNASFHYKISIFSVTGQKIRSVVLDGEAKTVLNKNLSQGIYLARLETNGEILKTTRFMVGW